MSWALRGKHLIVFGLAMIAGWAIGTVVLAYFWPHFVNNVFKKAIVGQGFGDGPVPVNTLYTEPQALFREPLTAQSRSGSNLMTRGVNHDTLLTVGWLDLAKGPLVLHVPDMHGPDSSGRYYSVQFTDPSKNTNFAYVGKRTTGTQAGDYLITGPGWKGQAPGGMKQISSPNNSVLLVGRVLVYGDSDLSTAYALSKQMQLTPLSGRQANQ